VTVSVEGSGEYQVSIFGIRGRNGVIESEPIKMIRFSPEAMSSDIVTTPTPTTQGIFYIIKKLFTFIFTSESTCEQLRVDYWIVFGR
jgi:hypothetical protein